MMYRYYALNEKPVIRKQKSRFISDFKEFDHFGMFEDYEIVTKIMSGSFSNVYEGYRKSDSFDSQKLIIKTVETRNKSNEVEILRHVKHENIIELVDAIRFKSEPGIQLFTIVTKYGGCSLNELIGPNLKMDQVQLYLRQILEGIRYLHSENIVHRDLKPSNIVYNSKSNQIKLIDFELSTFENPNEPNYSRVGTRSYMAPESISLMATSSFPVDIWSLGCILLKMVTLKNPFEAKGSVGAQIQLLMDWYRLPQRNGKFLIDIYLEQNIKNKNLRDLIRQMLAYDSQTRIKASQALDHRFWWDDNLSWDEQIWELVPRFFRFNFFTNEV